MRTGSVQTTVSKRSRPRIETSESGPCSKATKIATSTSSAGKFYTMDDSATNTTRSNVERGKAKMVGATLLIEPCDSAGNLKVDPRRIRDGNWLPVDGSDVWFVRERSAHHTFNEAVVINGGCTKRCSFFDRNNRCGYGSNCLYADQHTPSFPRKPW